MDQVTVLLPGGFKPPHVGHLGLANKFAAILSQRAQLEKLVDQVNAYIDQANTPETITIATNLRNNPNLLC